METVLAKDIEADTFQLLNSRDNSLPLVKCGPNVLGLLVLFTPPGLRRNYFSGPIKSH